MTATPLSLEAMLPAMTDDASRHLEIFALLTLGVLDAIEGGVLSPEASQHRFFTAANCLYARHALNHPDVDAIMSRGVEIPDILEALPPEEAAREVPVELEAMRAACLRILAGQRRVA